MQKIHRSLHRPVFCGLRDAQFDSTTLYQELKGTTYSFIAGGNIVTSDNAIVATVLDLRQSMESERYNGSAGQQTIAARSDDSTAGVSEERSFVVEERKT